MKDTIVKVVLFLFVIGVLLTGHIRIVEEPVNGGAFGVANSYKLAFIH